MKRLLFVLVAVLLMSLVGVVSQAVASNERASSFSASGNICLVQLPSSLIAVPAPGGVRITASGEILGGAIDSSDGWDALDGAEIGAVIAKEVSTFNFGAGSFSGVLSGSLNLDTSDGPLSGRFQGTVSGNFLDPTDIIGTIYQSTADIDWKIGDRDESARGHAVANFTANPLDGTYCGPIELQGIHQEAKDKGEDHGGHNHGD